MTAEATVQSIISSAQTTANTARDQAIAFSRAAIDALGGALDLGSVPTPDRPDVVIPPFDPSIDLTGDFLTAYNNAVADFDRRFRTRSRTSSPLISRTSPVASRPSVDGWICSTITDGGTGMNPDVEERDLPAQPRARGARRPPRGGRGGLGLGGPRGWGIPRRRADRRHPARAAGGLR